MNDDYKTLSMAIEQYGEDAQKVIAIEEMSKLIRDLGKSVRGSIDKHSIAKEMASVQVQLRKLEIIFSCSIEVMQYIDDIVDKLQAKLAEDVSCM